MIAVLHAAAEACALTLFGSAILIICFVS